MTAGYARTLRRLRLVLLTAVLLHATGSLAQTTPAGNARSSTPISILLARAAELDGKGRADLAAQAWRQVLFADPQNATALEGLTRVYAQTGDEAAARASLGALRAAHPDDPELANLERAIAAGPVTRRVQPSFPPTRDARLLRAKEASRQGDRAEAFQIYQSVFGANPPREWAIAYCQAEAAVPGRKIAAAQRLGRIANRYPNDVPLSIAWGRMLALDPATRLHGTQILARYAAANPRADHALRQSLLWGAASPAMAPEISTYLAQHSDPPLSAAFAREQSTQRHQAQTAAAYRALQQNNLSLAEEKFRRALLQYPSDRGALAGMGYVSLQRQNFSAAVHWLELAERDGDRSNGVQRALQTARFWQARGASQSALATHHPSQAEAQLHRALELEPGNPTAMLALARLYAETGRQPEALPLFRELAERRADRAAISPGEGNSAEIMTEAWSGWLASSAALKSSSAALLAYQQLPAYVQAQLSGSPAFLTGLAQAYLADNQRSHAEQVLSHAAQLPASEIGRHQHTQILLQYAALCVQDRNYSRAYPAYEEVVRESADNPASAASAWQGLVLIEHLQGRDARGLQIWSRMPSALRQLSRQDTSFLLLVAAMHASQRDFSSAIPLYRKVLAQDPNNIPAWADLLRAFHETGEDRQARDVEATAQASVRAQLRDNLAFFKTYTATFYQTMASVEQALGNPQAALQWLQRMDAIARTHSTDVPVAMQLQEAWLQYDLQQRAAAQASLQRLQKLASVRGAGTPDQQNQIAELTADLAVREAARMARLGNRPGAIQVLNTASNSVGSRTTPRLRLAAGYLSAGAPATAVAIYQSAGLQQATLGDRKAAISAAMESKQPSLAQTWLQQGLADSPHDAGLLLLAGNFAESSGDDSVATRYLQAALASSSNSSNRQHAATITGSSQPDGDDIHRQAAGLLASIHASHSGWLGGTGYISHIVGTPGTTQLTDVEVPLETSFSLGQSARFTAVLRTAYLNSGSFQGNPGQSLGTLASGAAANSARVTGIAGSLQIATRSLAARIGSTPAGFPVLNLTAAANLHNPQSPWTLAFYRDSIRESQLSYAGLHDPAHPSKVWGGVLANLGIVQYALGNVQSGWYVNASGGVVTGHHVASNPQITADAGAYRQIWSRGPSPATQSLKLGINLYVQHDDRNELHFTYGHGGYFSPHYYLLPAVPLTYAAEPSKRLQYELSGSLGPQILSQSSTAYFPLDPTLQASRGNPVYPGQFSIGLNYGVQGKISYRRGQHWLLGAFFSANNAASYNQQIGGFSLRYLFRSQHVSRRDATGWFPYSGLRPYLVPSGPTHLNCYMR